MFDAYRRPSRSTQYHSQSVKASSNMQSMLSSVSVSGNSGWYSNVILCLLSAAFLKPYCCALCSFLALFRFVSANFRTPRGSYLKCPVRLLIDAIFLPLFAGIVRSGFNINILRTSAVLSSVNVLQSSGSKTSASSLEQCALFKFKSSLESYHPVWGCEHEV